MKNIKRLGIAVAAIIASTTGLAVADTMGAKPQQVDLNIACSRPYQLNCTWYGHRIAPKDADEHPPYTQTFWFNFVSPEGEYCQYRLVPVRMLTCGNTWPIEQSN